MKTLIFTFLFGLFVSISNAYVLYEQHQGYDMYLYGSDYYQDSQKELIMYDMHCEIIPALDTLFLDNISIALFNTGKEIKIGILRSCDQQWMYIYTDIWQDFKKSLPYILEIIKHHEN